MRPDWEEARSRAEQLDASLDEGLTRERRALQLAAEAISMATDLAEAIRRWARSTRSKADGLRLIAALGRYEHHERQRTVTLNGPDEDEAMP